MRAPIHRPSAAVGKVLPGTSFPMLQARGHIDPRTCSKKASPVMPASTSRSGGLALLVEQLMGLQPSRHDVSGFMAHQLLNQ